MSGSFYPEGQGRLATGYGAIDVANATMEYEGVFSDEYGLEKFYLGDLNRTYAAEVGGSDLVSTQETTLSPVPLGRPPIMGEDLGQGLLADSIGMESRLVPITQNPQPEAETLAEQPGRQPGFDLWRAADGITIPGVPAEYTSPLIAVFGVGAVVLVLYYLKKTGKI